MTIFAPGTFTQFDNTKLFTSPATALRPNAYRLLLLWEALWARETRNDARQVPFLPFSHSRCPFPMEKATFRDARQELELAGFIVAVERDKGHFAASQAWKASPPRLRSEGRSAPPSTLPLGGEKCPPRGSKITPEGVENCPGEGVKIAPLLHYYQDHRTTTTTNQPKRNLKVREARDTRLVVVGGISNVGCV